MRVEDCIVSVERRSPGGCLDLAFVFAREFAGPLFRLWLICAVPSCVVVWLLGSQSTNMLIPSILVFSFFSAIFNALLVACMGPQVFGVPISVRAAILAWRSRLGAWLLLTFVTRFFQLLAGMCLGFPSALVTAFAGHVPEIILLEQAPINGVITRLNWLSGGGGYGRNLGRICLLLGYWSAMSSGLFVMLDIVLTTIFNRPVFLSAVSTPGSDFREVIMQLIHDDPVFLTTIQLALWLPYPVIRLAWFFSYLDQRIRNECWDLQLHFRVEAARLEDMA